MTTTNNYGTISDAFIGARDLRNTPEYAATANTSRDDLERFIRAAVANGSVTRRVRTKNADGTYAVSFQRENTANVESADWLRELATGSQGDPSNPKRFYGAANGMNVRAYAMRLHDIVLADAKGAAPPQPKTTGTGSSPNGHSSARHTEPATALRTIAFDDDGNAATQRTETVKTDNGEASVTKWYAGDNAVESPIIVTRTDNRLHIVIPDDDAAALKIVTAATLKAYRADVATENAEREEAARAKAIENAANVLNGMTPEMIQAAMAKLAEMQNAAKAQNAEPATEPATEPEPATK